MHLSDSSSYLNERTATAARPSTGGWWYERTRMEKIMSLVIVAMGLLILILIIVLGVVGTKYANVPPCQLNSGGQLFFASSEGNFTVDDVNESNFTITLD